MSIVAVNGFINSLAIEDIASIMVWDGCDMQLFWYIIASYSMSCMLVKEQRYRRKVSKEYNTAIINIKVELK